MVGIIFGSSMGNTEDAAKAISACLGVQNEVVNVANIAPSDLGKYSSLIVGSSTWNDGELQDDWADFDFDGLEVSGKVVAIFGMGDSSSYSDAYCNAMGELYEKFAAKGAVIIGTVATDGYEFDSSNAVKDGKFVGLALDNDNQSDLTQSRIQAWVKEIATQLV